MLEGAGEGALDGSEADMLDWLAKAWNIKIEIADGIAREQPSSSTRAEPPDVTADSAAAHASPPALEAPA